MTKFRRCKDKTRVLNVSGFYLLVHEGSVNNKKGLKLL